MSKGMPAVKRVEGMAMGTPPPIPVGAPSNPPAGAERIRARAYEIYQQRVKRGTPGDAVSDWVQAEREIRGGAGLAR